MSRLHAMNRLYDLLDDYRREVELSDLAPSSKRDYADFAELFVRWVDEDFTPGLHARSVQRSTQLRRIV